MKEFVYLDTSYLHSFIAQIYGGLPANTTNETQESRSQTKSDSTTEEETSEINGDLNLLFARAGTKIIPRQGNSESFSLSQLDAGKEIISKQLHDNAIDDLVEHLEKKELFSDPLSIEVNKFVLLKEPFKIVDIDYLKTVMDKQYHSILGINKGKQNQNNNKFNPNEMMKIFNFLSTILPSDFFIKQGKFLSPLKHEHIREKSKEMIFKYGEESEICVLGKITKKFDFANKDFDSTVEDFFSMNTVISGAVDEFLNQVQIAKRGDFVVSPIAIFFESA